MIETLRLPMACNHGDDGEAECNALMDEVLRRLSEGSEELSPRSISRDEFLTAVVMSLHWDYQTNITQIGADMWCGVWAERTVYNPDGNGKTPDERLLVTDRVFVACDVVEHGIATIWKHFADKENDTDQDKEQAHDNNDNNNN